MALQITDDDINKLFMFVDSRHDFKQYANEIYSGEFQDLAKKFDLDKGLVEEKFKILLESLYNEDNLANSAEINTPVTLDGNNHQIIYPSGTVIYFNADERKNEFRELIQRHYGTVNSPARAIVDRSLVPENIYCDNQNNTNVQRLYITANAYDNNKDWATYENNIINTNLECNKTDTRFKYSLQKRNSELISLNSIVINDSHVYINETAPLNKEDEISENKRVDFSHTIGNDPLGVNMYTNLMANILAKRETKKQRKAGGGTKRGREEDEGEPIEKPTKATTRKRKPTEEILNTSKKLIENVYKVNIDLNDKNSIGKLFDIKRAGDFLPIKYILNKHHKLSSESSRRSSKTNENKTGDGLFFVTHDRMPASFAKYKGVPVLFTKQSNDNMRIATLYHNKPADRTLYNTTLQKKWKMVDEFFNLNYPAFDDVKVYEILNNNFKNVNQILDLTVKNVVYNQGDKLRFMIDVEYYRLYYCYLLKLVSTYKSIIQNYADIVKIKEEHKEDYNNVINNDISNEDVVKSLYKIESLRKNSNNINKNYQYLKYSKVLENYIKNVAYIYKGEKNDENYNYNFKDDNLNESEINELYELLELKTFANIHNFIKSNAGFTSINTLREIKWNNESLIRMYIPLTLEYETHIRTISIIATNALMIIDNLNLNENLLTTPFERYNMRFGGSSRFVRQETINKLKIFSIYESYLSLLFNVIEYTYLNNITINRPYTLVIEEYKRLLYNYTPANHEKFQYIIQQNYKTESQILLTKYISIYNIFDIIINQIALTNILETQKVLSLEEKSKYYIIIRYCLELLYNNSLYAYKKKAKSSIKNTIKDTILKRSSKIINKNLSTIKEISNESMKNTKSIRSSSKTKSYDKLYMDDKYIDNRLSRLKRSIIDVDL